MMTTPHDGHSQHDEAHTASSPSGLGDTSRIVPTVALPIDTEIAGGPDTPFQPLFALVTDTTTRTTHHPAIHYIFSDDDPDTIHDALNRISQQNDPKESGSNASLLKGNDRMIVLDLAHRPNTSEDPVQHEAYQVTNAAGLSSDWAVVSTNLTLLDPDESTTSVSSDEGGGSHVQAVAGADAGAGKAKGNDKNKGATGKPLKPQRWMLRIEGTAVPDPSVSQDIVAVPTRLSPDSSVVTAPQQSSQQQTTGEGSYEMLIGDFNRRLASLRKVYDAGEERQKRTVSALPVDGAISPTHHGNPHFV